MMEFGRTLGTAMTYTAARADGTLLGGAILPGISLQLQSLAVGTANLPQVAVGEPPPPRFSCNTKDAIWSGVSYTVRAVRVRVRVVCCTRYVLYAVVRVGWSPFWVTESSPTIGGDAGHFLAKKRLQPAPCPAVVAGLF